MGTNKYWIKTYKYRIKTYHSQFIHTRCVKKNSVLARMTEKKFSTICIIYTETEAN